MGDMLRRMNARAELDAMHRRYFEYARIGQGADYPGARGVETWFGRNLKIFVNLTRLAPPAGRERVLVVIGCGHVPLLRRYAEQSGCYDVVDTARFLPH